jgi:hypothetical protein
LLCSLISRQLNIGQYDILIILGRKEYGTINKSLSYLNKHFKVEINEFENCIGCDRYYSIFKSHGTPIDILRVIANSILGRNLTQRLDADTTLWDEAFNRTTLESTLLKDFHTDLWISKKFGYAPLLISLCEKKLGPNGRLRLLRSSSTIEESSMILALMSKQTICDIWSLIEGEMEKPLDEMYAVTGLRAKNNSGKLRTFRTKESKYRGLDSSLEKIRTRCNPLYIAITKRIGITLPSNATQKQDE